MIDFEIIPAGHSVGVETYDLPSYSTGNNDQGQALYSFDGIEMTAEQAADYADFFLSDDVPDQSSNYPTSDDERLPEEILNGLDVVNDALGGNGAAEFYADELLGMNQSRMDEVLLSTGKSREELQSYAQAVLIDMADTVGIPHEDLMQDLEADIHRVRDSGSNAAMNLMHSILTSGIAGDYKGAMTDWVRLRKALRTVSA